MIDRAAILSKILDERIRQNDLPGAEYDLTNGPNDWSSIAAKYLTEDAKRRGIIPCAEAYQQSLLKAGAVILAALEHIDHMVSEGKLSAGKLSAGKLK
jgi:hypothetical protein